MEINLESKIEGLLFFKNEPLSISYLSKTLSVSEDSTKEALDSLRKTLENRGILLIENEGKYILGTHPDLGEIIESIRKQELEKELTKAGLETLSIILYKDNPTRSDIDFIRGVNSTMILRNLLIRGLIEKIPSPTDQRKVIYKPTFDLFRYLGITKKEELPEFDILNSKLTEKSKEDIENQEEVNTEKDNI